jgi:putative CocE/NonD family hydrolase
MKRRARFLLYLMAIATIGAVPSSVLADDDEIKELKERLERSADIEKLILVPMRDGVRLSTDVYRPEGNEGKLPTIFWRSPYNYAGLGERRLKIALAAIERGYAFVLQNERGKFYSEGEWEILGRPRTDGYDALDWIAAQPWSSGKVGTIGCSSSAEWQLALAATDHPAHAAMIPMASGAGIGRVGPFLEQGNWYKGGVFQMLFATWLYGVQNTQRPSLPEGLSREDLVRLAKYYDLAPDMPEVKWEEGLQHLPLVDLMTKAEGPKGVYAELIARTPSDPAWYEGGLYHDNEGWGVPSLWFNSWYDVSIGPNLALYNHIREKAEDPQVSNNQYVVIAPVPHCRFFDSKEEMVVGERNMGDTRLDYEQLVFDWFDAWLKEDGEAWAADTPKVRYYTMGSNHWQTSDVWPPADSELVTYYLDSDGKANSLFGNGKLTLTRPDAKNSSDTFPYDPLTPVPSMGGGVCCIGGTVEAGSFDQRSVEARHDVLVYTSEPLEEGIEVSGWIEAGLSVSSDVRDTDFTVKVVDVLPDGTAYNVDDTIQRARYRGGYDRQVFMKRGEIYELALGPMTTSHFFAANHRIRVEISSSNFPRYARNLNTGGNNYDEAAPLTARNTVHHSRAHASWIRLPVIKR